MVKFFYIGDCQYVENAGISRQELEARMAEGSLLKRLPRLAEVAAVAVLMASDRASAVTGAVANVTCGEIVDWLIPPARFLRRSDSGASMVGAGLAPARYSMIFAVPPE
jgi:hypothetical protein